MSQRLTKRFVESISPVVGKELLFWDPEVKGFGIRVFPTGRRTYFVQYRNHAARTRRQKIGQHGVITADQAREEAKKLLGDVCKGEDPSALRKSKKDMPTLGQFAQEYLTIYAKSEKKEKTYKEEGRLLQSLLIKRFGAYPLDALTTRELQYLHHEFRDRPYQANRIRALLHTMFNVALKWGIVTQNPVSALEKYKEHKRSRWLNEEEMARLWRVLDVYRHQEVANVFRLLLLTGARKNEVLKATWDQFDFKKSVWTKPAHTTKQAKMEHLPLSLQALALLQTIKSKGGECPYVFPGKVPHQPLKEIKKAWSTLRKQAGLPDVRIHDLRHT